MLKNLLNIGFRNILREKGYTLINVIGLATGITCSVLLLLYIFDELSYDDYHADAEDIYRVVVHVKEQDDEDTRPLVQIPLVTELGETYPVVKNATRFFTTGRELFTQNDKMFYEERFYYADSSVFEMFTYHFIHGDPKTAMNEPFSIVLTESAAVKYFGTTEVIAKSLMFVDRKENYKVTGVIKDVPHNSHFHFDALLTLNSLPFFRAQQNNWGRLVVSGYIQLQKGQRPESFQPMLDSIVAKHVAPIYEKRGIKVRYELQRITDIHLHSRIADEEEAGGDIAFVYILSAIAVFILVIACINYMNLVTARSSRRAREVGIRKVMGSLRGELILQFLGEALLMTTVSALLSIGMIVLLLPEFNYLAGKQIPYTQLFDPRIIAAFAGVLAFVAVFGGSYPAFYLSRFNPASALKGHATRQGNLFIRKTLVVVQFSISIFMLISTVVVYRQLDFLLQKDLGFDKEQILRIAVDDDDMRRSLGLLKDKLTAEPAVVHFGTASATPGENVRKAIVKVEDNDGQMAEHGIDYFTADFDFVETLGMTIVEGRNLSVEYLADTSEAILVNESMVKRLGWTNPLGKKFQPAGRPPRHVVGVLKDYHQNSLYDPIEPLVVVFSRNNYYSYIKLGSKDVRQVVSRIENAWKEVYPGKPFEYQFLDQAFQAQYDVDERRSTIFMVFAGITIVIACLGLLGLTAFTTEQRAKEISIRKVNGASTSNIVVLIAKEFVLLVIVAAVIAFPVVYYFMGEWLKDFAYRIEVRDEFPSFLASAAFALIITVATVSYHSMKAAVANPVEALREQ